VTETANPPQARRRAPRARVPHPLRDAALLAVTAVVTVGVAVGVAYLVGGRGEKVYGARVEILYRDSDSSALEADRDIQTQRMVLLASTTLAPVARRFNLSLEALRNTVSVSVPPTADVLRLTARNRVPRVARRRAQAIAERYVARVSRMSAPPPQVVRALAEQISAKRARLQALEKRATALDGAPRAEQAFVAAEQAAVLREIGDLEDRRTSLTLDDATQGARIISQARVLDSPLEPRPLRAAVAGLIVGLLVAAAVVLVALRLRR
jgi:capsular polysaccharide biosynthesis protein